MFSKRTTLPQDRSTKHPQPKLQPHLNNIDCGCTSETSTTSLDPNPSAPRFRESQLNSQLNLTGEEDLTRSIAEWFIANGSIIEPYWEHYQWIQKSKALLK
ncbi:hypothetical protein Droror1_Dr00018602 [Drosera rotundifolia]